MQNIFVREPLIVGDICRHVRLDKQCEQVAPAHVLALNATALLLALSRLAHDGGLLLCDELETDLPHGSLRILETPRPRVWL